MKRYINNPLTDDVTVDMDRKGDNPQSFTLKAGDIQEFDDFVCELFEDKIVDNLLWRTMPANRNREARIKEILEMIRT